MKRIREWFRTHSLGDKIVELIHEYWMVVLLSAIASAITTLIVRS